LAAATLLAAAFLAALVAAFLATLAFSFLTGVRAFLFGSRHVVPVSSDGSFEAGITSPWDSETRMTA
jgi:hypothetical protein